MFRKKNGQSDAGGKQSVALAAHPKHRLGGARSQSAPALSTYNMKSALKLKTYSESLLTKYGESGDGKKSLQFKDIIIREYERTLGDNPSCSSGPPMSISWDYYPDPMVLPLDHYENTRPPRRSNFEMVLPRDIRQSMLRKEWGVTQSQIAAAVRANIKVKNQRRTTVNNLSKGSKVEEALEKASRKVMKGFLMRNSTREFEKLEKQRQLAENQRKKLEGEMPGDLEPLVGI